MPKTNRFEWYKKYPKDFHDDEVVKLMGLQEIGLYNILLDHAWTNGSIPENHEELAKIARVSKATIDKLWPLVGRKFSAAEEPEPGRLVNARQERERLAASERSLKNKRPGNANASKSERDKNAIAFDSRFFENANVPIRASGSGSMVLVNQEKTSLPAAPDADLFGQWFGVFIACGLDLNETDQYRCLGIFAELTPEEQRWCVEDCQQKALKRWRSKDLTKDPWNYLHERPWTRRSIGRVLPDAAKPESRADAAQRKAAEAFRSAGA